MTDTNATTAVINETSNETISTTTAPAEVVAPSFTLPAKFKDVDSLIKSYEHLESRLGASIIIPAADATKEEMDAFQAKLGTIPGLVKEDTLTEDAMMAKLGKPASPEGYKFTHDADSGITTEDIQTLTREAHELGLTNKQAQALLDKRISLMREVGSLTEQSKKEATNYLKEKFGAAYDERMAAAQAAVDVLKKNYGAHAEALIDSGALENPALVAILADIGHAAQERSVQGTLKTSQFHMTPDYAKAQLDTLNKSPEFLAKFLDRHHPQHAEAVATYDKYQSALYANIQGQG